MEHTCVDGELRGFDVDKAIKSALLRKGAELGVIAIITGSNSVRFSTVGFHN